MKTVKKASLLFLLMLTVLAMTFTPASAVTHGSDSVANFTPPAGWSNPDGVYREFHNGDAEIFAEEYYYLYYDVASVRDRSESEWANYYVSLFEKKRAYDDYYEVPDCTASYETINGYDYVKVAWEYHYYFRGLERTYYYIDYICIDAALQRTFVYSYRSEDSGMPHVQDFYTIMGTVTYGGAPAQGSDGELPPAQGGTQPASGADDILIYVNGSQVFPDAAPVIQNGRTLVPIRVIAEALGYNVEWDGVNQVVTVTNGNEMVRLIIGASFLSYLNSTTSSSITLDVPAQIISDRTYLPLRAVGEAIGASVDWDGATRSVFITK